MSIEWEKVAGYQFLDPSGKVGDGMKIVERYLPFVGRQQDFALQGWRARKFDLAIVDPFHAYRR